VCAVVDASRARETVQAPGHPNSVNPMLTTFIGARQEWNERDQS
jgi:hypothetical protein